MLDFLRKGILSDRDIALELARGRIIVDPLPMENISINSVDVRLGQYVKVASGGTWECAIDEAGKISARERSIKWQEVDLQRQNYRLLPGQFLLGATLEKIGTTTGKIVADIADKSTLARMGLAICAKSGWVDPGNVLRPTLEISNRGHCAIELCYGQHIAQVVFHYQNSCSGSLYSGKYRGSDRLEAAK